MKRITLFAFVLMVAIACRAQQNQPKDTPQLEFALQLRVTLGETYSVGETQHGRRTVIPITGGTFEGPLLKGTILNGGADYQYVDHKNARNEIEAIYCIRTDDGVNIHIRNAGLIVTSKDDKGNPQFYFRTSPKFDAPNDSKYAWLNNAVFVCTTGFGQGYISLLVWMLK